MATGQKVVNNGLKIAINRIFKASPDYLAPSKFSIGISTTTPTISDTSLGSIVNINGGATKSFVTGYPTLDETNFQATIRCFLNSAEGNGNSLTEFGLFNEDASPLMYSHSVFTAISKTSTVEVSFVQKDQFE